MIKRISTKISNENLKEQLQKENQTHERGRIITQKNIQETVDVQYDRGERFSRTSFN